MSKILLGGIGGTPTENVLRSIDDEEIIGVGSEPFDMMLSKAQKKYQVPYAGQHGYRKRMNEILDKEHPDFAHFQNDLEVLEVSKNRDDFLSRGIKLYLPTHNTICNCVDKEKSAQIWMKSDIKVAKMMGIKTEADLKKAFDTLGDRNGMIWIRQNVGGGGKGALPTNNYDFAKLWIDRFSGWGKFSAAELLTEKTVTWLSIWYEGELVVAQTRRRDSWDFGNRTLSGVTGVTRVGMTVSDSQIDSIAEAAIMAIDRTPHGIYGVDMTYDANGIPNPTEINIGRFFTTVYFFTTAGLNMPKIYKDIALYNKFPALEKKINPLQDGLIWIRGMDYQPILTTEDEIRKSINLQEHK
ncbi:MAG: carboxylate--amine ligase [bacterium]|nr:carboxylate--amine ligase [bacterium]